MKINENQTETVGYLSSRGLTNRTARPIIEGLGATNNDQILIKTRSSNDRVMIKSCFNYDQIMKINDCFSLFCDRFFKQTVRL